jgi:hypothetical protein
VAENVRLCVATGVAGLSIEDATGDRQQPLYDLSLAVARIQAARAAIEASSTGVLLTARAECFLVGHADPLREAIRRLQAYAEAGADVLYAPGPQKRDEIAAIVAAVAPKPVNVVITANSGLRLAARPFEHETVVTCFGDAAQIDRLLVLVADDEAEKVDIEIPADREIPHRQHAMARTRDVEGRIVDRLGDAHGARSGGEKAGFEDRLCQYDFGRPRTFSAMKLRIMCGVTGAMRAIMTSRKYRST